MNDSEKIIALAKFLHDVINEICANDDKTIENLKLIQRYLNSEIIKDN